MLYLLLFVVLISEVAGAGGDKPYDAQYCTVVKVSQRLDCGLGNVTAEADCNDRDCCWTNDTVADGAPKCFATSFKWRGYKTVQNNETSDGMSLLLRRHQKPRLFPSEVDYLTAVIEYETNSRIHLKIWDGNSSRYEVPISYPAASGSLTSKLYEVTVTERVFGIIVKRAGENTTIIDTQLSGMEMIFSDQFLELTMGLSSSNVYGLGGDRSTLKRDMNYVYNSMWNRAEDGRYGSHPFYLNVENDGRANGVLLMNSNAMDVILNPFPAVQWRTTGGVLDFYIFLGPTPNDVISQYTAKIGRPMLPAWWSLGYHLGRQGYKDSAEISTLVQEMKNQNIPLESIWTDTSITHDYGLTLSPAFSGLLSVISELKDSNQHYITALGAAIKVNTTTNSWFEQYKVGRMITYTNGTVIKDTLPDGGSAEFPDFFNTTSTGGGNIYKMAARSMASILKLSGVALVDNEPLTYTADNYCTTDKYDDPPYKIAISNDLSSDTLCASAKHVNNALHYNLHNINGLKQTLQTGSDGTRDLPYMVMSQTTFPGSGASAGHTLSLNSTWDDMALSISGMLNFNMFGVSVVGADVCGYHGNAGEELCVRWHQLGALSPFFRNYNSAKSKAQDPTSFSEANIKIIKSAIELRYKLLPMIFLNFYNAHITGVPVIRPLFFEFPSSLSSLSSLSTQYLWGNNLMVVPTLKPAATQIEAYFPDTTWYDFHSGRIVSPGKQNVSTTLSRINLYIRGGSILTQFARNSQTTKDMLSMKFLTITAALKDNKSEGNFYFPYPVGYRMLNLNATNESLSVMQDLGYASFYLHLVETVTVLGLEHEPAKVSTESAVTRQVKKVGKDNIVYDKDKKSLVIVGLSLPINEGFRIDYPGIVSGVSRMMWLGSNPVFVCCYVAILWGMVF